MTLNLLSRARALVGLFLLTAAATALAQGAPVEGRDYRVVRPAQPVETPGKIEVIEFFWYGCPHCNSLEPSLKEWIKRQGPDVVVRQVPVAFNDSTVPHQRLYYALEALNKESELRTKVFAAIHGERNPLNREGVQADFAAKNGIDRQKFIDAYNSFGVQSKTRRASQLAEGFGVDGVPMIAVNGKYLISNSQRILQVADYFVASERNAVKVGAAKK